MNIQLIPFAPAYSQQLKLDIADFFAFHGGLVGQQEEAQSEVQSEMEEVLLNWQKGRSALYVILLNEEYAGFLRLDYRGDQVAWIEDLYVRPAWRGQGVASQSIALAEKIVAAKPGYTAVCMDVAPRNDSALRLYYRLGYDSVSLITLRKEFGDNPRDRKVQILDREFRI